MVKWPEFLRHRDFVSDLVLAVGAGLPTVREGRVLAVLTHLGATAPDNLQAKDLASSFGVPIILKECGRRLSINRHSRRFALLPYWGCRRLSLSLFKLDGISRRQRHHPHMACSY